MSEMAKPRERAPFVELSAAFQKKAQQELERLRGTVSGNLREEMISLLEDETHADLLITNGVTVVRAHQCIVQARCRHLWQETWLTLRQDPETDTEMSFLYLDGLGRGKLVQFVRQLYSVSDSVLLVEEYMPYLPGGSRSTSLGGRAQCHSFTSDLQLEADADLIPDLQPDSSSNFTPDLLPAPSSNLTPDLQQDASSNLSPDLQPDVSSNLTPDLQPDVSSNLTPDLQAAASSNLTTELQPDVSSNLTPDLLPDTDSDLTSDLQPDARSNLTPNLHPDASSDLTADLQPGTDMDAILHTEEILLGDRASFEGEAEVTGCCTRQVEDLDQPEFVDTNSSNVRDGLGNQTVPGENLSVRPKTIPQENVGVRQMCGSQGVGCQETIDRLTLEEGMGLSPRETCDSRSLNEASTDKTRKDMLVVARETVEVSGSSSECHSRSVEVPGSEMEGKEVGWADHGRKHEDLESHLSLGVFRQTVSAGGEQGKDFNEDKYDAADSSTQPTNTNSCPDISRNAPDTSVLPPTAACNADTSSNSPGRSRLFQYSTCSPDESLDASVLPPNTSCNTHMSCNALETSTLPPNTSCSPDMSCNAPDTSTLPPNTACSPEHSCDAPDLPDTTQSLYTTCSPLGRDLLNMYLHNMCCDCCLSVNGVHFLAHKCVLSARSEYFLAMFGGQWSESKMATVNLEAVSPHAVKQLILFLYGGVVDLCEEATDIKELFVIADMYGVLTFRTVLMFYVKRDLCHFFHKPCPACVLTSSEALTLSHNFCLEELQTRCLKWMAKYFTKIWPTKSFSLLEDCLHQLCFESIVSQITASNVLDIIIECTKLVSSLPRIKWTENVLYLVTRLMDAAIEFTSAHFIEVLKTPEFLQWAKVACWKASALEDIFHSVIDSLPVDTACLVFITLTKLQELHACPENPEPEISALLEAMITRCEKFFKTHIHHVTRSRQWFMLPQPVQARILEVSAYVYLPEPAVTTLNFKQNFPPAAKIKSHKTSSAVTTGTIPITARTGKPMKTSPSCVRHGSKSRLDTRLAKSLPGSIWSSGSKTRDVPEKAPDTVMRVSSRDRLTNSTSQTGRAREESQIVVSSHRQEIMSAKTENQRSPVLNIRNSGGHSLPNSTPRSGSQVTPQIETQAEDHTSDTVHLSHTVIQGVVHECSPESSGTCMSSLSVQASSTTEASKHPVGQKGQLSLGESRVRKDKLSPTKHLASKLPTLIRRPRSTSRQQSLPNTGVEACTEMLPESVNLSRAASVDSTRPLSQILFGDTTADRTSHSVLDNRVEEFFSEVLQKLNSDAPCSQSAVCTSMEDLINVNLVCGGSHNLHTLCDVNEHPLTQNLHTLCDVSEYPLTQNPHTLCDVNDHPPTNNLCQITSVDECGNSLNSCVGIHSDGTFVNSEILAPGHETGGSTSIMFPELEPEVKIVRMSRTLNIGFIVPPE